MIDNEPHDELTELLADLQEEEVLALVKQRLADGVDPLKIIDQCHKGLHWVGERYEKEQYYISALIMAGEIMRQVGQLTLPLVERKIEMGQLGSIVLGTVEGDIHFIGKDIFKVLVQCHGFNVHDLGEDVPAERFLNAVTEFRPDIVGISCLISSTYEKIGRTIDLLRRNIPEDKAPAFIVGGLIDQRIFNMIGADYWANDAMAGVRICQKIIKEKNSH